MLQALFPAPAFIDFPGRDRGREGERPPVYRQAALAPEEELKPRTERLTVVGTSLQYKGERGLPGLYISGMPLSVDKPYFEVEITKSDGSSGGGGPVIGLCSHR